MKKFLTTVFLTIFIMLPTFATVYRGEITKQGATKTNQVVDMNTNMPIDNARISVPQKNYKTYTDAEGRFDLSAKINGQTIMSVEKEGYKPFSLTVDERIAARPMVLGIEKNSPHDILLDAMLIHIGDNNYSSASANAGDFKAQAVGPFYTKKFKMATSSSNAYLVIGSIIGIDTKMAQAVGQNNISETYASPPEVFFNGSKIAEIQLNGDGQRIKLPPALIKPNMQNEITIKTGKNLMQRSYVDYDDIEVMNLSIQID